MKITAGFALLAFLVFLIYYQSGAPTAAGSAVGILFGFVAGIAYCISKRP